MNKHEKEPIREPMSPDYLYDQEHARSADECLQDLRHRYNGLLDELEAERKKVRIEEAAWLLAICRLLIVCIFIFLMCYLG